MAIEPKGKRKRISKRGAKKEQDSTEAIVENTPAAESSDKKSSAIPTPMFQSAPTTVAPAKAKVAKSEEKTDESEDERGNRKRRRRGGDRKSTRLNSSHTDISRMPSSA